MIRVTTLYASGAGTSAEYYTGYLTKADGELAGVWTGAQAPGLGLSGEVTTEALEALLSGLHPSTGQPLGRALVDRVDKHGNTIKAVAGYDATLSAPKSLSVLWGLTGDDGWAQCHDFAVNAVVEMIEKYGSTTRIRSNGKRLHPETKGLSVAVFRQSTSRADDPQLHSHVVISSKVQTADGRWYALDAQTLKKYQQAFGYLYQSVLRAEVTARYGVVFDQIVQRSGRDRRCADRVVGSVLEAGARDRRRDERQACRLPSTAKAVTHPRSSTRRWSAKRPPTPVPRRQAPGSRICGHGGPTKPPASASTPSRSSTRSATPLGDVRSRHHPSR